MKTVFALGAHPDDVEFFMAGTMILLAEAGYALHIMNLANGCCGTTQYDVETIQQLRREEAKEAAESIGAVYHDSLTNDLEIFYDRATLAKVASIMREVAPEILLTHPPVDYLEDHTNACRLAVTAAFCRGMPNFPVDPPWPHVDTPVTIYHCQPNGNRDPLGQIVRPEMFVDIGDVIERKTDMLSRHQTQKAWLDESQGMDSYLHTMRSYHREVGQMSERYEYAEGWRKHLHLGFCGEQDDPLRQALSDRSFDDPHYANC